MRKVQNLKAKKSSDGKQYSQRSKKEADGVCMSAPGKNNLNAIDSDMYLKIAKRSDANSVHGRGAAAMQHAADATSRFSSCTAKTSPSTDNNSNDNCHVQDFWDKALQANICQQSAIEAGEQEPLTPSRVRACSDNTQSSLVDACSPTGNRPVEKVREIISTQYNPKAIDTGSQRSKFAPQIMSGMVASGANNKANTATKRQNTGKATQVRNSGKPLQNSAQSANNNNMGNSTRQQQETNEMTGGRITTPYPGKYKTVMCKFFNQGRACPFGIECNYAHGKNQLKQRDHRESPTYEQGIEADQAHSSTATTSSSAQQQQQRGHTKVTPHMARKESEVQKQLFPERSEVNQQSSNDQGNDSQKRRASCGATPQEESKKLHHGRGSLAAVGRGPSIYMLSSDSEKEEGDNDLSHQSIEAEESKIDNCQRELRPSSLEPISVAPLSPKTTGLHSSAQVESQPSFAKKNSLDVTSEASSNAMSVNHGHKQLKVANIYSTILAGIQNNLTVRKTQSESATQANSSRLPKQAAEPREELEDIFEVESIKEICDLPGLEIVKRLSCFEEICPSEQDDQEDHTMMQVSNMAAGSVINGLDSPGIVRLCSMDDSEECKKDPRSTTLFTGGDEVDEQKKSTMMFGGNRNRKGKNRKFRKIHTVDVAY